MYIGGDDDDDDDNDVIYFLCTACSCSFMFFMMIIIVIGDTQSVFERNKDKTLHLSPYFYYGGSSIEYFYNCSQTKPENQTTVVVMVLVLEQLQK